MPKADTENQLLPEITNDNKFRESMIVTSLNLQNNNNNKRNKKNICYACGAIIVIVGLSLLINYDINYNRENDNSNSL